MDVQQLVSIAPWTMIFQILNLLLLTVLFKKFLFKPVTEILDKRKSEIENHYSEAEKAENDAKTLKQGYEAKMAGARQEADQVIKTATDSANVMSGEIIQYLYGAHGFREAEGLQRCEGRSFRDRP